MALAIMAVANEEWQRRERHTLALDVARAATEARLPWEVERTLRALTVEQARRLFDDLAAAVGNGAATRRVFEWLAANVASYAGGN